MKVRENDKPSAQHSMFLKMFKQLRLEIGLKDALVEMPKFNKWLSSLLRNKEILEEIAITTVNAECSAIIISIGTSALAILGGSLNLLLTLSTRKLGLMLDSYSNDTRACQSFHYSPNGVPIILGRPFLRTAKALIDLYEETLTLRVGKEDLVYYADKSEKNKNKHFVHAISVIDFSKDDPFSGSTTTHSDDPSPSSSPVKTSDNLEEFADELTLLKKDIQEGNFQDHLNPLFEFDDNFKSSTINPRLRLWKKIFESLPVSPIPVEDSEPAQEEIDIFLVPDDLIPPGVENDDSEDKDNELPNLDHQDDPSIPRPPPEPLDIEKCFEPAAGIVIIKVFKVVSKSHDFMADILPTLPTLVLDLTFILFLSSFLSFR
ncbi:reverse transcriptase domain-containing protein [Tanacetum coccineum]